MRRVERSNVSFGDSKAMLRNGVMRYTKMEPLKRTPSLLQWYREPTAFSNRAGTQ